MTDPGRQAVHLAGAALVVLDVALTAALYDRLPPEIAVHWSAAGVADSVGGRATAWALPVLLAFVVALGLVAERHVQPHERGLLAGAVLLAALYLFGASLLLLLANVDDDGGQQGSVARRWMVLLMTAPPLVLIAGCACRRRSRAG